MKRYVSADSVCPYYQHEFANEVVCEGVVNGSETHIVFTSKLKSMLFKNKYCHCSTLNYENCPIAKIIKERYDDKSEERKEK